MKKQIYDFQVSYFIPAFNLPSGTLSYHAPTVQKKYDNISITIDTWLIKASKKSSQEDIFASLLKAQKDYEKIFDEKHLSKEKQTRKNEKIKTDDIQNLLSQYPVNQQLTYELMQVIANNSAKIDVPTKLAHNFPSVRTIILSKHKER